MGQAQSGPQGPQGQQGPQGPQGPPGPVDKKNLIWCADGECKFADWSFGQTTDGNLEIKKNGVVKYTAQ